MAGLQIPNPSITSGAFASMLAFSSDNNTITAISGHPIAGVGGGGTPVEGYWRPSVNTDGDISWTWSLESTSTAPSTANIKGPQGIQGETGPQGPSGTNGTNGTDGKDGANGISPTFTITPTAGGTHVVISGAQGKDSFDVLSGAKGADGAAGFSPTITLTPVNSDASHNNGGTQVEITYKSGETTATTAYTAWNGNDGEGASVNLFGNNGVSVTKDGTNYTVGLSGGYYSDTLSAYSAMYAGYASNAKFGDNSVSSMDQLKGSIDRGNQIAGEYATHSGDYVTSSVETITGTKQYALTTAGWAEVQAGGITGNYLPTSGGTVSGQLVVSGGSNFDNQNLQFIREGVQANGRVGIGSNGALVFKHNNGAGQSTQLEFSTEYENGEYKNGSLILKANNTEKSRVVNVTTSGYTNMDTFDPTNGPNYMLRKLPDGSFDIGAKVVNVTALPGTTDANTYYFIYDQT